MHSASVGQYGSKFFGMCGCGWTSGYYSTADGAWGACILHEQSQMN